MKRDQGYTIVTLPVAIVKRPSILYLLSVIEARSTNIMGRLNSHRSHVLVRLDMSRLTPLVTKTNRRMINLALEGETIDNLADRLLVNLAQFRRRADGAAKATLLSGKRLEAVFGLTNQLAKTGGIEHFASDKDVGERLAGAAGDLGAGAGLVGGAAGTSALIGSTVGTTEITLGAFVAGATGFGLALGGIAVIGAFAGGYLIGTGLYKGAGAISDWVSGDDDADDPVSLVNSDEDAGGGGDGDSDSDAGGDGDGDSDDDDAGGDGDGGSNDDDAGSGGDGGSDDDDAGNGGDGDSDDGDAGIGGDSTPTPDDEPFAAGALLLYLATGLGSEQVEQQRRAIEILRGGAIGVPEKQEVNVFALDAHIASAYIKLITRQIEAKKNQYGWLVQSFTTGPINYSALPNFGLINPSPLDLIFFGQTNKTLAIARGIT